MRTGYKLPYEYKPKYGVLKSNTVLLRTYMNRFWDVF